MPWETLEMQSNGFCSNEAICIVSMDVVIESQVITSIHGRTTALGCGTLVGPTTCLGTVLNQLIAIKGTFSQTKCILLLYHEVVYFVYCGVLHMKQVPF